MSDAQIQAEKAREQKTLAIQAEMRKIEKKTQEDSLSTHQKIRMQLRQEKKVPIVEYKEIAERMKELESKNFTYNFTTCTRYQHDNAFRNKTDPPEVGKYRPKEPTAIGVNSRFTKFGYTD